MLMKTREAKTADEKMYRILIATTTALALMTGAHAHAADFGETNVEKGCIILSMSVSTRIEDMLAGDRQSCAKLKARFKKAEEGENIQDCMIGLLLARNRMRGLPDFDAPDRETRVRIAKGCIMVIADLPERQADYLADKIMK
jgi:hypothetical protein